MTELAARSSASCPSISRWPSSEFGTSTPLKTMADPIPVPSVVRMTSPLRPFAAPYLTSARPAASASLTTWTSRPVALVNSASASVPIHPWSMLAAELTTPCRTTAGTVTPTEPVESGKRPSSSANTSATASGVDGLGVLIRTRSAAKSPAARSTGAPLMPEPPKSMPKGCESIRPISRTRHNRSNRPDVTLEGPRSRTR